MRRRTIHIAFGAAAVVCAVFAVYEGLQLRQAERANEAIAHASTDSATSAFPEAQLAQAIALAKKGDYEGALQRYKALSRGTRSDLALDALYNTGNLHIHEAVKEHAGPMRTLPLIELAKQSYRAVIRRDPTRWDARYNLERALWIAPELDETPSVTLQRDAESRVMSTLQNTRADLP